MSALERVHVTVYGRVQGIGYRYFAVQSAKNRNLVGFVRNEPEGTVVVEVEGPMPAIYSFLHDLGKGPRMASVTSVDVKKIDSLGQEKDFRIRYW